MSASPSPHAVGATFRYELSLAPGNLGLTAHGGATALCSCGGTWSAGQRNNKKCRNELFAEIRTVTEKHKTAEQTRSRSGRITSPTGTPRASVHRANTRWVPRSHTPESIRLAHKCRRFTRGSESGGNMRTYGRDVRHLRTLSAVIEDGIAIFAQDVSEYAFVGLMGGAIYLLPRSF